MREHATDDEVCAWPLKVHHFDPVRWLQARIKTSVNPPIWVGNQWWRRRGRLSRGEDRYARVNIARLRAVIIDDHLVKTSDDKVYGAPSLDLGYLGNYHVVVEESRVRDVREPVVRRRRHPRTKADGCVGQVSAVSPRRAGIMCVLAPRHRVVDRYADSEEDGGAQNRKM